MFAMTNSQTFKRKESLMKQNREVKLTHERIRDKKFQLSCPRVCYDSENKDLDATTNDVVAPWWNVLYEEQLLRKEKEMRQVLKRCNRRIAKKDREKEKKMKEGGRAGSVKQPCNEFLHGGYCKYGDRCKYLHISLDEYEKMLREGSGEGEKKTEEEKEIVREKAEGEINGEIEVTTTAKETTEVSTTPISSDEDGGVEYSKVSEEDGQICTMLPILTAEPHEGYRNKCSFTIGMIHIIL